MAAARRAAQLVNDAMTTIELVPTVARLTRINQQKVWSHMARHAGLTPKSISTYMISVRAALNYCALPQIIMVDDEETEVRLLDESVPVFCDEAEIANYLGLNINGPREYLPTFQELGKWIDRIEEDDDFRYVIIALNTAARNEAIFDLRVSEQVDYEFGLIDLNPKGRRQTKKRRPVLRLTTQLAAWLEHWKDDRPIAGYQDVVEKRINKIGRRDQRVSDSGEIIYPGWMPEMTCYILRHFIASYMRRTKVAVSREQRSLWLGHRVRSGSSTTDWYEKFDPDYLDAPARATEEIILKLQKYTRRSLLAPTMHSQGKVRIIDGGKNE
jgi:integrase